MRTIILSMILLGFAGRAFALTQADLNNRIRMLTVKFEAMQETPTKRIPAETLRKAKGIALLDRTKAGFLFAYQGGSGIAMVKDEKTDKWGPLVFLSANQASLGFQIGGQQSFIVILFMNTNAARSLTTGNIQFGGEASGTAGDESAGVEGNATPQEPSVLVYANRQGLYGGVSVKGGSVSPDPSANCLYYGQAVSTDEILFEHKVKPSPAAISLADKIATWSKPPKQ